MSRRISVVLDLEAGRFTAGMAGAATATSRLNINLDIAQSGLNRVENRMKGLLATTRDLTVILGQARTALYNLQVVGVGWISTVIKTNVEMERLTFLLANMSDKLSVEERFRDAGDGLDYLFDKAKQAPFSINALTDSFVKMKSGGIDPTKGGLDGLTNAVAAFGGTDETLKRASIAIQQMSGKGVISMEELRQQLGEAVPSAVALMARSMNLSYGELVDRVSKGQVEASTALSKMFGEFERTFGGSSQAMMDTFAGKVSVAKTSLIEMALAIGGFDREAGRFVDGGLMSTINAQIQTFIDAMKTPEAAVFAKNTGEALTALFSGFNSLVSIIVKYQDVIITAGKWFLIYFGSRAALASVTALMGAFSGLTGATGALGNAMRGLRSNGELASVAFQLFTQRAATGREAAVALGQAAVGAGRSFAAMLGPISAIVIAVLAAADAFGLLEDRAKNAKRAADNYRDGFATDEDIKASTKNLNELRGELEKLEKWKGIRERESVNNPGVLQNPKSDYNKILKQIKEKQIAITQAEADLALGLRTQQEYESNKSAAAALRRIDRETRKYTNAYNKQAEEITAERNAIFQNEVLSEEEKQRKYAELDARALSNSDEFYRKEIAAREKFIADLESQKKRLQDGINLPYADVITFAADATFEDKMAAIVAATDRAGDSLTRARETAAVRGQMSITPNKYFGGTDTDTDTKKDPVGDLIDSLSKKNAGLQAELEGTGKEIAKVEEQIRIWGQEGVKYTIEQEKEMRKYAKSIDDAGVKIKRNREDEQSMGRLTDQLERQAGTARELSAVLAGGYSEVEAEAAIFKIRLDQIVEGLHEGKDAAALMAQETADLFAQNRATEFLINLKRTTQEINTSLLQGNEAAQARHDADIARIYEIINLTKLSANEQAIVNDYIAARGEQLKRETEGQFRGTLRTWTDTTAAMDQAAANWMDNFVNALVEGKASFGDFAKAILADIAKIILRAVIAQAILSAIGAFGAGSAGAGTASSANVGNVVGGGLNRAPTSHTGGVVGEKTGFSKTVSAAIFASAKRFHEGGLVGLKSDEVPTILQTGERVLDRGEARAYGRGTGAMNVQVNIINEGGQKMEEQSRSQRFDGESYVIDIVTAAAGQPGKMRNAIKEAARSS